MMDLSYIPQQWSLSKEFGTGLFTLVTASSKKQGTDFSMPLPVSLTGAVPLTHLQKGGAAKCLQEE
jgi:hypothetical protein